MKFNRILEQFVKESEALIKIILKVDPKNSVGVDFRDYDGYEGYIIKESETSDWDVMIENIDIPIIGVPASIVQIVDMPRDMLEEVKALALARIHDKKMLTDEIRNVIVTCNNIEFLEQFLRSEGLDNDEIKNIYKQAVSGQVTEGVFNSAKSLVDNPTAKKITKGLGVAALATMAPDYAIAKAIKGTQERSARPSSPKSAYTAPPGNIKAPLTNAPRYNIRQDSPLFASGALNNTNNVSYYRDASGNYYHINRTGDVIRVTIDPQDSTKYSIRFINLKGSGMLDYNKVDNYFENTLPTEIKNKTEPQMYKNSLFNL